MTRDEAKRFHALEAQKARGFYLRSRTPEGFAKGWHLRLRVARAQIKKALRESRMLFDLPSALVQSGRHMLVYRHLLAPPMSQDQFKIICPEWRKGTEKTGTPLSPTAAKAVTEVFHQWRGGPLTPWVKSGRQPNSTELRRVLITVAPLIASQSGTTAWRNQLAADQETAVIELLNRSKWTVEPSKLLDRRAELEPKHYMHKTRFATRTASKEVDIACGLGGTKVLAMECKVTNDETNSVKRIDDVLNKATAWKDHWGSFVEPAALLQGVIAGKEVARLIDAGVHVFWSHDLDALEKWLARRL